MQLPKFMDTQKKAKKDNPFARPCKVCIHFHQWKDSTYDYCDYLDDNVRPFWTGCINNIERNQDSTREN